MLSPAASSARLSAPWRTLALYCYVTEARDINVLLSLTRPNFLKRLFTDFITFTVKVAIKAQVSGVGPGGAIPSGAGSSLPR